MIKGNFIRLLVTLSDVEFRQFELFLHSPYFNTKAQPRLLLRELKQSRAKWRPALLEGELEAESLHVLDKEFVAGQLFPGEPYKDTRMRRIISDTNKLLEKFIAQQARQAPEEQRHDDTSILRHHLRRGEHEIFERRMKKVKVREANTQFRDQDYYFDAFQTEELNNQFRLSTGKKDDSFPYMLDMLDAFYVLSKLRYFCAMHTRGQILGRDYDFSFLDAIQTEIRSGRFDAFPLIRIYDGIFRLERGAAGQEDYRQIMTLIRANRVHIPGDELRQLFGFILNYLLRESRKPNRDFLGETFERLKEMLVEGFIYINDMIIAPYFSLILDLACKVEAYEWAESFIHVHADKLSHPEAAELVDYSLLLVWFHKGDYADVLQRIDRLKFKGTRNQLRRRSLKLRSLYQAGDAEGFLLMTDAFGKFIKSKSDVGVAARTHYLNFVRNAEKLGRIRFNLKAVPKGMREELEVQEMAYKEWVMEKLSELVND